jgi:DNA-binding HxlR family transcriptional regulator
MTHLLMDSLHDELVDMISHIESPIERALELLGDRYSLLIISALIQFEKLRFVELEQQITGISPRTLSARLKHLERHGMIQRQQFPTIPPKVEYSLTDTGRSLNAVLNELQTWANHWYPHTPASTAADLNQPEQAVLTPA